MSQIYKNSAGGSGGSVNTLTPDQGGVITPVGNNINVLTTGSSSVQSQNFNNGIRTVNGGAAELDVVLTNRATGQVTTNNAVATTIITFPLGATPGVYNFTGSVTAFDSTDVAGACYNVLIGVRTTGAAGTFVGADEIGTVVEPALNAADVLITISVNSLVVQVLGIAAKTIDWDALLNYRFVG